MEGENGSGEGREKLSPLVGELMNSRTPQLSHVNLSILRGASLMSSQASLRRAITSVWADVCGTRASSSL